MVEPPTMLAVPTGCVVDQEIWQLKREIDESASDVVV